MMQLKIIYVTLEKLRRCLLRLPVGALIKTSVSNENVKYYCLTCFRQFYLQLSKFSKHLFSVRLICPRKKSLLQIKF